jgi:ABC-type Fe3+-hydroxamate transport system substrate-binding protein
VTARYGFGHICRVVSLVPSITETLLSWGIAPVGVTRFCDAPGVPAVGGTKNPDLKAIGALAPDLVVVDTEENRASDATALEELGLRVHVTQVRSLDDVGPTLARLAAAVGRARPEPSAAMGGWAPAPDIGFTAWVPIWRRPWMSIGGRTYGSTLLRAAGIANVYDSAADPYPTMTLPEAAALRPDLVLAPSEPYPFKARHRDELEQVAPVVFVDGQDLFWWGSRTPAALDRLRQLAATRPGR